LIDSPRPILGKEVSGDQGNHRDRTDAAVMAGGKPEHHRRPPLHERIEQPCGLLGINTAVGQHRDPAPGWAQVAASRTIGDEIGEGGRARVVWPAGVEVDDKRGTGGGS
jgi:hypothetical protein